MVDAFYLRVRMTRFCRVETRRPRDFVVKDLVAKGLVEKWRKEVRALTRMQKKERNAALERQLDDTVAAVLPSPSRRSSVGTSALGFAASSSGDLSYVVSSALIVIASTSS